MKVKKLKILNFRGFHQATINFPDSNLAVFIGTNGKGKSSVLDLIAIFLTQFLKQIGDKSPHSDFVLKPSDVHSKESQSTNQIALQVESLYGFPPQNEIQWQHSIQIENGLPTLSYARVLDEYGSSMKRSIESKKKLFDFPILAYYVANRYFDNDYSITIKRAKRKNYFPRFAAFENAFEKKLPNFHNLITWYREEEDIENQETKRLHDFNYRNPKLETLRKSIVVFFESLGNDVYINLRVERALQENLYFGRENTTSLVITKNGNDFRLEQLSDGEKMLLMVVCDIARRLSIANPSLSDPLQGEGIVLIDEIELHLHPKWQREVIPALMATFPNIQFLVTTHSPQVLSSVDQESIFLLQNGEVFRLSSDPKGLDTNAILEEIMDTPKYPQHIDVLIDELFALIQQREFGMAEAKRQQIVQETSPDYPVLRQADALMERLKILNT